MPASEEQTSPRAPLAGCLWFFFLWPLKVIWRIITMLADAIGILFTLLLGLVLMALGLILIWTVIGAFIGIPLFLLGLLLLIRGLW